MAPTSVDNEEPASTYTLVLRCRSSVRLRQDEGQLVHFSGVPGLNGEVEVRIRTRWLDEGQGTAVPRELWFEVRCVGESLDSAVSAGTSLCRYLASLVAFTANVTCGPPEVHLAFESGEGLAEREFLEVFLPDERGFPRQGRLLDTSEFTEVFERMNRADSDAGRISRALNQYELALRHWYLGGEYLALSHLYMAVEALTRTVISRECERQGIKQEELARRNGIDPDDSERPRWRPALESWARLHLVFEGDTETYQSAKRASDGIEHGFLEMNDVVKHALKATGKTFQYVRRAILGLLNVDEEMFAELHGRPPRDVESLRRMVRGRFIGSVEDIAPIGEEYPYLEWSSRISSATWDGDRLNMTLSEQMTVHCHPDVTFQGTSFEVRGRLEEGYEPIAVEREAHVEGGPTAHTGAALELERRAFRKVVAFATTLVSEAGVRGVFPIQQLSLLRLSAQIAGLEAIQVLLADNRATESSALFRGLVRNTCILQLSARSADGKGIAIRAELDALDRQERLFDTADVQQALERERAWLQRLALDADVAIPPQPVVPESAPFMQEHAKEVDVANEISLLDKLAIAQHLELSNGEIAFRTQGGANALRPAAAALAVKALTASAIALAEICGLEYDSEIASELATLATALDPDD